MCRAGPLTPYCSLGAQVSLSLVRREAHVYVLPKEWTWCFVWVPVPICVTCVLLPRCLSQQVKNKPWCFSTVWVEHSFESSSVKVIGTGKNLLLSDWCQSEFVPFSFSFPPGFSQRHFRNLCLPLLVMLWLVPSLGSSYVASICTWISQWSLQETTVKWFLSQ